MRRIRIPGEIHVSKSSNSTPAADEYVRLTSRQSPSVFSISSGLVGAVAPFGPSEKTAAGMALVVTLVSTVLQALSLHILIISVFAAGTLSRTHGILPPLD